VAPALAHRRQRGWALPAYLPIAQMPNSERAAPASVGLPCPKQANGTPGKKVASAIG
jgi:hypothetical protein